MASALERIIFVSESWSRFWDETSPKLAHPLARVTHLSRNGASSNAKLTIWMTRIGGMDLGSRLTEVTQPCIIVRLSGQFAMSANFITIRFVRIQLVSLDAEL